VSPNGLMFVKHYIRRSLLAKMLDEFLDTRVMVKEGMKAVKDDKVRFVSLVISLYLGSFVDIDLLLLDSCLLLRPC
jgi:DNA polymerase elongation subunit (family B)